MAIDGVVQETLRDRMYALPRDVKEVTFEITFREECVQPLKYLAETYFLVCKDRTDDPEKPERSLRITMGKPAADKFSLVYDGRMMRKKESMIAGVSIITAHGGDEAGIEQVMMTDEYSPVRRRKPSDQTDSENGGTDNKGDSTIVYSAVNDEVLERMRERKKKVE